MLTVKIHYLHTYSYTKPTGAFQVEYTVWKMRLSWSAWKSWATISLVVYIHTYTAGIHISFSSKLIKDGDFSMRGNMWNCEQVIEKFNVVIIDEADVVDKLWWLPAISGDRTEFLQSSDDLADKPHHASPVRRTMWDIQRRIVADISSKLTDEEVRIENVNYFTHRNYRQTLWFTDEDFYRPKCVYHWFGDFGVPQGLIVE